MIADLRQRRAEAEAKGQKQPPMYHKTANERITFVDKDHARVVDGQWPIRMRNVAPQD